MMNGFSTLNAKCFLGCLLFIRCSQKSFSISTLGSPTVVGTSQAMCQKKRSSWCPLLLPTFSPSSWGHIQVSSDKKIAAPKNTLHHSTPGYTLTCSTINCGIVYLVPKVQNIQNTPCISPTRCQGVLLCSSWSCCSTTTPSWRDSGCLGGERLFLGLRSMLQKQPCQILGFEAFWFQQAFQTFVAMGQKDHFDLMIRNLFALKSPKESWFVCSIVLFTNVPALYDNVSPKCLFWCRFYECFWVIYLQGLHSLGTIG